MQFQHGTQLEPTLVQRITKTFNSPATNQVLIPAGDATLTIIIQQIVVASDVTSIGELIFSNNAFNTNVPTLILPSSPVNINMPVPSEQMILGTYGLKVTDSSTGGFYIVNLWYSIYQN